MPNSTNFSAKTDGAHVTGTLTDHLPVNPNIPPTGLQAIGPRVTFNFITDAWSDENSYQYYDVVQVSGNSYIARQNVPTGIDISDTDYWIHWADPNAQFQELLNTVNSFDNRITTNSNNIITRIKRYQTMDEMIEDTSLTQGEYVFVATRNGNDVNTLFEIASKDPNGMDAIGLDNGLCATVIPDSDNSVSI